MSRYRLQPTREQEIALLGHCSDARYVWNLAVEQHAWWRPGRGSAPGYLEQCRQLTAARAGNPCLAGGSQMVQRQALRDFARAMVGVIRRDARHPPLVAQGREGRGIPGRRAARPAVGRATAEPELGPGPGAGGRLGAVPLVP